MGIQTLDNLIAVDHWLHVTLQFRFWFPLANTLNYMEGRKSSLITNIKYLSALYLLSHHSSKKVH